MRDHEVKGERYYNCALCDFITRESETFINSAGLRVCIKHDADEGQYRRPGPVPDGYHPQYETLWDITMNQVTGKILTETYWDVVLNTATHWEEVRYNPITGIES